MIVRTLSLLGAVAITASTAAAQPCPAEPNWPIAVAGGSATGPSPVNAGASGQNRNGTLCAAAAFNGGSVATQSSPSGRTVAFAANAGNTQATASADLTRGELRAAVTFSEAGTSGIAEARFRDRLTFTNTSGNWQSFRLLVSVDGSISGGLAPRDFFSFIGLSSSTGITPDIATNPSGFDSDLYAETVREAGNPFPNDPFQFRAQVGLLDWWMIDDAGGPAAPLGPVGPQVRPHIDVRPGSFDYLTSILLWVPTGTSSLDLDAWLRVGSCSNAFTTVTTGSCDFGNTGAIRLLDVHDELTWTSESGVFLSALTVTDPPPTSVPEPPAALLLAAGALGLIVARGRRAPRASA